MNNILRISTLIEIINKGDGFIKKLEDERELSYFDTFDLFCDDIWMSEGGLVISLNFKINQEIYKKKHINYKHNFDFEIIKAKGIFYEKKIYFIKNFFEIFFDRFSAPIVDFVGLRPRC